MTTTRRTFLQFALTAAASSFSYQWVRAEDLSAIDVAYAGSMGSLMEGPIKASAAKSLHLDFHGRAQGSNALAS